MADAPDSFVARPPRGGARYVIPAKIDDEWARKRTALGAEKTPKAAWSRTDVGTLGVLGIAFALHRWIVTNDPSANAEIFGGRLAEEIKKLSEGLPPELSEGHLRAWVQASRPVALPPAEWRQPVMEALIRLAARHGLNEAGSAALSQDWIRPSDLLNRLLAASAAEPGHSAFQPIDPLLRVDAPLADSRQSELEDELGDLFTGAVGGSRIIVLWGAPFSGKRGFLNRLIKGRLDAQSGMIPLARGGESLPLFARANCSPIEILLRDIALFLGAAVPADRPLTALTDQFLASIRERARVRAAAYILGDVPNVRDPLVDITRIQQFRRLLDALDIPGSDNRLLLTSADRLEENPYLPSDIYRELEVTRVTVEQFAIRHELQREHLHQPDRVLDGPLRRLLALVLDLAATGGDMLPAEVWAILNSPSDERGIDWAGRPQLQKLAKSIYRCIRGGRQRRYFRCIALLAGGPRLSLLYQLAHCEDASVTRETVADELRALARMLPGILFEVSATSSGPAEDPPGEAGSESHFELVDPFRRIFERAVLDEDPVATRADSLMVASLLYDQLRWLAINAAMKPSDQSVEITRHAQIIRLALISIDPHEFSDASRGIAAVQNGHPAGLASGPHPRGAVEASAFQAKGVGSVTLFRFLLFDLLRNDLDWRYRLGVEFRRDDLRLNLLLSFCNVGRAVYTDNENEVAFSSWTVLTRILSTKDCIDLLTSIAVSAMWIGAWHVLAESAELAKKFRLPASRIARIHRCQSEVAILICGSEPYKGQKDLCEVEIGMREILRQLVDEGSERAHVIKLRSRLAHVMTLQGRLDEAEAEFANCDEMDSHAMPRPVLPGSEPPAWHRSALAGRGARRYAQVLFERAMQQTANRVDETAAETMRGLLAINRHRLTKRPNEWPAMIVGEAMLAVLRRKPDRAERLIYEFAANQPSSGLGMTTELNLQILVGRIALHLCAESPGFSGSDLNRLRRTSLEVIRRILQTSHKDLHLPLYLADAQILAAKYMMLFPGDAAVLDDIGQKATQASLLHGAEQIISNTHYYLRSYDIERLREFAG